MVQVIREQSCFWVLLCLWAAVHGTQLNTKCLSEEGVGQKVAQVAAVLCSIRPQTSTERSSTITTEHCVSLCTAISLFIIFNHRQRTTSTIKRPIKRANQSMPSLKIELNATKTSLNVATQKISRQWKNNAGKCLFTTLYHTNDRTKDK